MRSKRKIIQLKLAPDNCKFLFDKGCPYRSCEDCIEQNKNLFAEEIVNGKKYRYIFMITKRALLEHSNEIKSVNITPNSIKKYINSYIKEDFKDIFNGIKKDVKNG